MLVNTEIRSNENAGTTNYQCNIVLWESVICSDSGDPACPRICLKKKLSGESFTVRESADRNGNEGADGCCTSADCRQLINFETVLISRTSGDRLIIV